MPLPALNFLIGSPGPDLGFTENLTYHILECLLQFTGRYSNSFFLLIAFCGVFLSFSWQMKNPYFSNSILVIATDGTHYDVLDCKKILELHAPKKSNKSN